MTVSFRAISTQNKGGCIYSPGSVTLGGATVTNCLINNRYGKGGGVYAMH